ncbi:hypothetical protein ACFW16_32670 [Inquilinus sp. NPDC058860]|uniref:hypothetical protein n=1 Tax=Inquilinus sp. NPDC058860 TaxID=3346652 RepID=UPI0036A6C0A0
MTINGLLDAASVLDDQASGREADRARILSGALALDTLCREGTTDRDILDAAAGLQLLAAGGSLDLDESGRVRAARLAAAVRTAAGQPRNAAPAPPTRS